jgi:endonuclease/exonuclease/phosphatase family metal-dependent hydrolase
MCTHSHKEKEEINKDTFCDKLNEVYQKIAAYDARIIMGDFNAKIGKKENYRPVTGKHSLHDISNDNVIRAVDFAMSNNLIIKSTHFPHKNIHKQTWESPDGHTRNKIDHVMVNRRHSSSVMDVRSCRGADMDTDRLLVRIKYHYKISRYRNTPGVRQNKYCVKKLRDEKNT